MSDGLEADGANINPDEDDTGSARESEVEEGADRGRMGRLSAVLGRRRRRWVVDDSDSGGEDGGERGGRTEAGGAGGPVRLGGGGKSGWVT